ncbi:MAG: RluA family pseudouridine synthase [Dokdonella sp.]
MMTRTSGRSSDPAPASAPISVQIVKVPEDRDGQRIDNFLSTRLKGVPRSLIYRILRTGQVRINGKRAKPDQRLAADDEVRIPPVRVAEPTDHGTPADGQLDRIEQAIIHEDRDFLVLSKPSGVASHGGSGISFGAIELLRAARPRDTLELVHRLDRDTSGVLVFSRRRSALTGLQAEIREGRASKAYVALVRDYLPKPMLTVNAPLLKSVMQGGERMVRVDPAGKPSISHLREVTRFDGASLIDVVIDTGRTHQIRVHCTHVGNPIAGDEKYGDREFDKRLRDEAGLKRLFLHAARFAFDLGDRHFEFDAPLPDELQKVLKRLAKASPLTN